MYICQKNLMALFSVRVNSLSRIEYIYSDTATTTVLVVDHSGHVTHSLVFVHGTQSRILSSLSVQSMRRFEKEV